MMNWREISVPDTIKLMITVVTVIISLMTVYSALDAKLTSHINDVQELLRVSKQNCWVSSIHARVDSAGCFDSKFGASDVNTRLKPH